MPDDPRAGAPDANEATAVDPSGPDGSTLRWYQRLGPATVAFGCALVALLVAIATAPSDSVPRLASSVVVTGVVPPPDDATTTATTEPTAGAVEAEPQVLGVSEDADAHAEAIGDAGITSAPAPRSEALGSPAGETVVVSVNGIVLPTERAEPAAVVNGALRSRWTFSGAAIEATPGDRRFASFQLTLSGALRFASDIRYALDIRCVSGDCPDGWDSWTPLPVGVVEPNETVTLVAGEAIAREAQFEIRTHPDPTTYVSS